MSLVFEKAHTGQKHEQVKKKKQKKHQSSVLFSLSFENKCPQWNNALSTDFSNNSRLNVSDGKYCIVGEAHGFRNSTYICSECWNIPTVSQFVYMEAEIIIIIQSQTIYYLNISKKIS